MTVIDLTCGSFPIHIGVKDDEPILWESVNQDSANPLKFCFRCIPTGGTWNSGEYGGIFKTVQMPNGLVWHYAYTTAQ